MKSHKGITGKYIHYGCGTCAPPEWRNFDSSPTLRIQKMIIIGKFFKGGEFPVFPNNIEYGDIVKGLPLTGNSVDGIFCSHVLEHLSYNDCRKAITNTYGYLKKGGRFRFIMPDLESIARIYINSDFPDACHILMDQTSLGKKDRVRNIKGYLREIFGNSSHLWMWDYKGMYVELASAGFQRIRKAEYGDSEDPMFLKVEDKKRWLNSFAVECEK